MTARILAPSHISMTSTERERLKESLRAMIAGRGDGIDLDTEFRWVVSGICQPDPFFRNLSLLLGSDAILYFEGSSVAPDVAAFYESCRAQNPVAVIRDTVFPVPDSFHVRSCFGEPAQNSDCERALVEADVERI